MSFFSLEFIPFGNSSFSRRWHIGILFLEQLEASAPTLYNILEDFTNYLDEIYSFYFFIRFTVYICGGAFSFLKNSRSLTYKVGSPNSHIVPKLSPDV